MSATIKEAGGGQVLEIALAGKLVKEDYEQLVPAVERLVRQRGKIRMLVAMHDFHGWSTSALWEDTKFAAHHFSDIERLAVVGERKWQRWMAAFCKPFTRAQVHYFDSTETEKARGWVLEAAGGLAAANPDGSRAPQNIGKLK